MNVLEAFYYQKFVYKFTKDGQEFTIETKNLGAELKLFNLNISNQYGEAIVLFESGLELKDFRSTVLEEERMKFVV
jgi:hypothetical protein